MHQNLENLIRERAYEIWTSRGCVHDQADQHWLAAEREILTASTTTLPPRQAGPTKDAPMDCTFKDDHSITLSARSTRPAGTSCPIAWALLRLITSSNVVGCSTGRSAGFAPLSILATMRAR